VGACQCLNKSCSRFALERACTGAAARQLCLSKMQEDAASPRRNSMPPDQVGDAVRGSLEAYLHSGKDPNHFLTRAKTQAMRTKQFGLKPEPMRLKKQISPPSKEVVHVKSDESVRGCRPPPLAEVPESEVSDPEEPDAEDVPLRRASSDLEGSPVHRPWKDAILGSGRELMRAVKHAPIVRSLMSDGGKREEAQLRIDNKQEEAADCKDQCSWRVVLPEQDEKAEKESPVLESTHSLLAPGMVNDEESPKASGDLEASKISTQTTTDGDQSSRATSAVETPIRLESDKLDKPDKPERRISEMVRGVTTTSQTQDLKTLIHNHNQKKAVGKETLLAKLVKKKWHMNHANKIESAIDPVLAKFGNFRRSSLKDIGATVVPGRLFSTYKLLFKSICNSDAPISGQ